jgi:hypothetical protein
VSRRRVARIRRRTIAEEALGVPVFLCDCGRESLFADERLATVHKWTGARTICLRGFEPGHTSYVAPDVLKESILEPQVAQERTAQEPACGAM